MDAIRAVTGNLQRRGYSQIAAPSPNAIAMFKQASGLGVPRLVCMVRNTDAASSTFRRYEAWFEQVMGRSGGGLLLLVQNGLPDGEIANALDLGRGMMGYGQVVCGVYDESRNACYLPKGAFDTYHMGWDQEVL